MKYLIAVLLLLFMVTEANAVVYCAAGVYHAGCVARPPMGAYGGYVHPYARPYGHYGYGGAVYHRPGTTVIRRY
jgi:hypothetical protein